MRRTILAAGSLILVVLFAPPSPTAGSSLEAPLRGCVRDPKGAPIEGATVRAFRVHRKPGSYVDVGRSQVTPADGTFCFPDLPTGSEWRLEIEKDGLAQDEDPDYRIATQGAQAAVILYPEKPLEIRLLCDEAGGPVAKALLYVGLGRHRLRAVPTGKGVFTVRGYSGRKRVSIDVSSAGYHRELLWHEVEAEGPVTVRLRPTGDVDVSGVVVDAKGRPVAQARVLAFRAPRPGSGHLYAGDHTDRKGRFTLPRLMARETYRIQARGAFGKARDLASEWVTFVPRKDLTLRLIARPTGKFSARISVPDGLPPVVTCSLRFARVDTPAYPAHQVHYSGSHYSGKRQTIRAAGLVPGTYDVVAYPFPYPEVHLTGVVVTGKETTKFSPIAVRPGAELRVDITGPPGRTAGDYRVRLLGENRATASIRKHKREDGSVVHARVPAGVWRMFACEKGDRVIHDLGTVTVVAGKAQSLTRKVPAPGRILVRVRDGKGDPIGDHAVVIRADRAPPLDRLLPYGFRWAYFYNTLRERELPPWADREILTEPDGEVEIGPIGPGAYEVRVGTVTKTVTVPAGGTVVVEFAP